MSSSAVEQEQDDKPQEHKRSSAELRRDIQATRRELAETLNALEYKLDVPARFGEWKDDRKQQFIAAKEENPTKVYGLLGVAAAGLAGIIAGVITLTRR